MIRFEGELSGESKNFLMRTLFKMHLVAGIINLVLWTVIFIAVAWITSYTLLLWFMILPVFWAVALILPPSKKAQRTFMPTAIFIDLDEKMIVHQCEGAAERFHSISSVNRVDDYGEWYHFVFEFGDRDVLFVCQKDLIVEGTIEEFESLFEGKIVRKEV